VYEMTVIYLLGMLGFGVYLWGSNSNLARRLLALSVDMVLLLLVMASFREFITWHGGGWIADSVAMLYLRPNQFLSGDLLLYSPVNALSMLLLPVVVSAWFECSDYRATPGKFLMRVAVSDRRNSKPTFWHALIRNAVKWISLTFWPLLLLSIALVYFKGKALHDYLVKGSSLALGEGIARKLGNLRLYENDNSTRFRFDDHEDAGAYGETLLLNELERLKSGGVIGEYGSTHNMVFNNRNFELDGYAMVPGLGIIVMEAKFYSGKIYPGNMPHWDNIKTDGTNAPKKNPCVQLERSTNLFTELLESKGLFRWPVYSMVIMSHPGIQMVWGDSEPQYTVLGINMLEDFIRHDMQQDASIAFSNRDYAEIRDALQVHYREYVDRSAEYAN
jgi:uncharacterized RDD family membrane protein YckC